MLKKRLEISVKKLFNSPFLSRKKIIAESSLPDFQVSSPDSLEVTKISA